MCTPPDSPFNPIFGENVMFFHQTIDANRKYKYCLNTFDPLCVFVFHLCSLSLSPFVGLKILAGFWSLLSFCFSIFLAFTLSIFVSLCFCLSVHVCGSWYNCLSVFPSLHQYIKLCVSPHPYLLFSTILSFSDFSVRCSLLLSSLYSSFSHFPVSLSLLLLSPCYSTSQIFLFPSASLINFFSVMPLSIPLLLSLLFCSFSHHPQSPSLFPMYLLLFTSLSLSFPSS